MKEEADEKKKVYDTLLENIWNMLQRNIDILIVCCMHALYNRVNYFQIHAIVLHIHHFEEIRTAVWFIYYKFVVAKKSLIAWKSRLPEPWPFLMWFFYWSFFYSLIYFA